MTVSLISAVVSLTGAAVAWWPTIQARRREDSTLKESVEILERQLNDMTERNN